MIFNESFKNISLIENFPKKLKIAVTGGEGFIGTNLCIRLNHLYNCEIVSIDNNVSKSSNLQFHEGISQTLRANLNEVEKIVSIIKNFDLVIHLAASGNVIESVENPIINFENNVVSTLNLLEAIRRTNIKKIIFASTGGALMGNTNPPVNEESLPKPISPYGASKLACEGYLSAYAESFDIKSIALRFGNVYGPYSLHKKGVINKWIKDSLEGNNLIIYGDGKSTRDYIYVDDICLGIEKCIRYIFKEEMKNRFEQFHLANNQEITLNYLSNLIISKTNSKSEIIFKEKRKGEVTRNFADVSKATLKLNFDTKFSLDQGLNNTIEWIKKYTKL